MKLGQGGRPPAGPGRGGPAPQPNENGRLAAGARVRAARFRSLSLCAAAVSVTLKAAPDRLVHRIQACHMYRRMAARRQAIATMMAASSDIMMRH